jgi:hypothetical protein
MSIAKQQLWYDATDADTIADSDRVGAVVLSDDGTSITHHTVGSDEGLDVYLLNANIEVTQGTDPWIIGDGGNSITVDAVDLDIRDLAFATDKVDVSGSEVSLDAATLAALETITVEQGTSPWVIGDGGGSITVDAVDLDIRDLSAAQDSVASHLFDGAGTALTSTLVGADQALDVNVVGGVNVEVDLSHVDDSVRLGDGTNFLTSTTIGSDIGLDVNVINDPATANISIANAAETLDVANTAQDVVVSPLANRKYLWIHNYDNRKMFIGGTGVTVDNGFPIYPSVSVELQAGAAQDVEFVSAKVGHKIRTLELS